MTDMNQICGAAATSRESRDAAANRDGRCTFDRCVGVWEMGCARYKSVVLRYSIELLVVCPAGLGR